MAIIRPVLSRTGVQQLLKASVNKAGSDAVIKAINLRYAMANLKSDLAIQTSQVSAAGGDPKTDPQIKAMSDKVGKLALELAINAETTQSATVAGETHDTAGH